MDGSGNRIIGRFHHWLQLRSAVDQVEGAGRMTDRKIEIISHDFQRDGAYAPAPGYS